MDQSVQEARHHLLGRQADQLIDVQQRQQAANADTSLQAQHDGHRPWKDVRSLGKLTCSIPWHQPAVWPNAELCLHLADGGQF